MSTPPPIDSTPQRDGKSNGAEIHSPPWLRQRYGRRIPRACVALVSVMTAVATFAQSVPPGTPVFQELHSFGEPSPGALPKAGLILGQDGFLYGTSPNTRGFSTLFKLRPDGSGFAVLHYFDEFTEGMAEERLLQGPDGTLYGITRNGTQNQAGTLFKINPDGTGMTLIHSFGEQPVFPLGPLIWGSDGALYGTTLNGGGSVFRINPNGTGFTNVRSFTPSFGLFPVGVIQASNGALYGTASSGGGLSSTC